MIRRPPRSTPLYSSAASDVYKRREPGSWAPFSDLKHLPAGALGPVLATRRARGVGQVQGLARRVAAGREGRHGGLPLRPARARIAARQPPLGNCHQITPRPDQAPCLAILLFLRSRPLLQIAPSGIHVVVVPMVRIVVEICAADRADAPTILGTQRCER